MAVIPALLQGMDLASAGLNLGDESYLLGDTWWLLSALGTLSIVAVFRLAFGWRDWLAATAAAGWVAIGAAYALGARQFSLLGLAVLIFFLITTGTVRDRLYEEPS
jgi:hypothetical protein